MTLPGLSVGDTIEASQEVTADRTASHIGSGAVRVYATPAMALFVERTCHGMIARHLPEGKTSVGVELRVRHLAPTPLGSPVYLKVEVVGIEDETVDFVARLRDDQEPIGEVEHRRRVVDLERFLKRVGAKSKSAPKPPRPVAKG
jgi:predicted thioesterase